MKKINILIMPTDMCNMSCVYCFHNNYHNSKRKMTIETLKRVYDIVFNTYDDVQFIWHGGEPLCMGLDFYKQALYMQLDYKEKRIINRMQSNLTLMTDEFAKFLCENSIGLGSSFDGVDNDKTRGNTERILRGRNKIVEYGGTCGFIMVLSQVNVFSLIKSYEFFKSIKANYSINTYVETSSEYNQQLILDANIAIDKLKEFFEFWVNDKTCNIHVEYFERFIKHIVCGEHSVCKYNSCLGKWVGIRYDGSVVPCNRFFPDEFSMGNIWDYESISSAFKTEGFNRLLSLAIERRYKCQKCDIFDFCVGGCNNVALNENGISNNNGTTCIITREMYSYIYNYLKMFFYKEKSIINPIVLSLIIDKCKRNKNDLHIDVHVDEKK